MAQGTTRHIAPQLSNGELLGFILNALVIMSRITQIYFTRLLLYYFVNGHLITSSLSAQFSSVIQTLFNCNFKCNILFVPFIQHLLVLLLHFGSVSLPPQSSKIEMLLLCLYSALPFQWTFKEIAN